MDKNWSWWLFDCIALSVLNLVQRTALQSHVPKTRVEGFFLPGLDFEYFLHVTKYIQNLQFKTWAIRGFLIDGTFS